MSNYTHVNLGTVTSHLYYFSRSHRLHVTPPRREAIGIHVGVRECVGSKFLRDLKETANNRDSTQRLLHLVFVLKQIDESKIGIVLLQHVPRDANVVLDAPPQRVLVATFARNKDNMQVPDGRLRSCAGGGRVIRVLLTCMNRKKITSLARDRSSKYHTVTAVIPAP